MGGSLSQVTGGIKGKPCPQRGTFREQGPPTTRRAQAPAPRTETRTRPGYARSHRCDGGIDRPARSWHRGVRDRDGNIVVDPNRAARPETFRKAIAPFKDDLIVAAQCRDAWDGRADLGAQEQIAVGLGQARYRKLIDGTTTTNDTIAAGTIARWRRGGNCPLASVYPRGRRATRDLLRRRTSRVRQRAARFTHRQIRNGPDHRPPFPKKRAVAAHRPAMDIA